MFGVELIKQETMRERNHNWEGLDSKTCATCGDKQWMNTSCRGVKKTCNYPDCNCPFDMGSEGKCLVGYDRLIINNRENK